MLDAVGRCVLGWAGGVSATTYEYLPESMIPGIMFTHQYDTRYLRHEEERGGTHKRTR